MHTVRRFFYALILTGLTVAAAYWLAIELFGNLYYLAQLLPIALAAYLLLGWLIYLRRDDFFYLASSRKPVIDTLGHPQHGGEADLPEAKVSGEEVSDRIVIKDGLVQRKDETTDSETFWHESMYVFLWSAVQLGITAALLYNLYGIGSKMQ